MKHSTNGFTLIELLVVITIIGLLASTVLASVQSARANARDTVRIQTIKQIETALELYRNVHGNYPAIIDGQGLETGCIPDTGNFGHCDRLLTLTTALAPYITIDPTTLSSATQGTNYFSYSSKTSDNNATYGMMFFLEKLTPDDGGFFTNAFEAGTLPRYCMSKYSSNDRNWLQTSPNWSFLCRGGN